MGIASKIPVLEGGPAGSGVREATISAAPERPRGAVLGETKKVLFKDISQKSASVSAPADFCPPLSLFATGGGQCPELGQERDSLKSRGAYFLRSRGA
jgi:hypothetical protein